MISVVRVPAKTMRYRIALFRKSIRDLLGTFCSIRITCSGGIFCFRDASFFRPDKPRDTRFFTAPQMLYCNIGSPSGQISPNINTFQNVLKADTLCAIVVRLTGLDSFTEYVNKSYTLLPSISHTVIPAEGCSCLRTSQVGSDCNTSIVTSFRMSRLSLFLRRSSFLSESGKYF